MAEETIKTILEYEVNQASVNRAAASARQLAAGQQALADTVDTYGPVARASVSEAVSAFNASRREIEFTQDAVERLNAEIADIPDEARAAEQALSRISGPGRAGGRQAIAETVDRFGSFGSQVVGALGGSEIANVTGLLGDLAGGIQSLGPAALIGAGALGAVTLAFADFNRQLEQNRATLTGALSGFERYYAAVRDFSSADAARTILEGQRNLNILQQERDQLQRLLDSAFSQAESAFGGLGATVLDTIGALPTQQLRDRLSEIDRQIQETTTYLTLLGGGLQSNAFFYQDAQQKLERNRQAVEELTAAQERWNLAIKASREEVRLAAEAQRRAYQESVTNSFKAAVQQAQDAAQGARRAQADFAEVARKQAENVTRIERDYAEQRQRQAEQTAERIYQIERDFGRSRLQAIANRDALALVNAQQQRADALDDLRRNNAQAEREQARSFQRQLAQAQEAARAELNIRQQALQAAIAQQQQAQNALLAIQRAYNSAFVQETAQAGALAAQAFKASFASAIAGAVQTASVGAAGSSRTLTLNVVGATQKQVVATSRQQAVQVFADVLRAAGLN